MAQGLTRQEKLNQLTNARRIVAELTKELGIDPEELNGDKAEDRAQVRVVLRNWQKDADLAGIRDNGDVAKLPAEEQEFCRKLWADVESLLKRAQAK